MKRYKDLHEPTSSFAQDSETVGSVATARDRRDSLFPTRRRKGDRGTADFEKASASRNEGFLEPRGSSIKFLHFSLPRAGSAEALSSTST